MTRDEIVTALRCVAVCGGCDCTECESRHIGSGTCVLDQDEYFSDAADLIENQQRHIEALMKANDSLKDAIARRDKQIEDMNHMLDKMPTIDAVPVVRCKDCKHRYSDSWCEYVDDDDNFYCARGERKDGAD